MKFQFKKREEGSVLIWGLVVGVVAGITLASYLTLISNRYKMTSRSMEWNQAMPVLEAGIEEAMAHLHYDSNNVNGNGWTPGTISGQPVNTKTRTFSDGSYFSVVIYNGGATNPTIYSSGFVPGPNGEGYISRTVKVTTQKPKTFSDAIAATGTISLAGQSEVDSYDSEIGPWSSTTNGFGTNASVVTDSMADPAIAIGTGHVYGTVDTGPGGTVTANGVGGAGSSGSSGIEPGWSDDSVNVSFPSNSPPEGWQSFLSAPAPITAGGSNILQLTSGSYQMSSLTLSGKTSPMFITGNVTLYVTGNVNITANSYIAIAPGASLTLYVAGSTTSIGGGGIVNGNGVPSSCTYIGLVGNTSMTYSGGVDFVGTVNAPEANFSIAGGANIFGAAIVNTYSSVGGGAFHYDTSLDYTGTLVVLSWQETF